MNHLYCKGIGCFKGTVQPGTDFCEDCSQDVLDFVGKTSNAPAMAIMTTLKTPPVVTESMSARYPKYYKSVGNLKEVDVYAVHMLFQVDDPSGALQHASKKLLLSGCRTGGKSAFDDVREARDTLNRWLELNAPEPMDLPALA